jgi:hypothetical protein
MSFILRAFNNLEELQVSCNKFQQMATDLYETKVQSYSAYNDEVSF